MNDSDSEDSHDSFVTMEEIIPGHDESSDFIEDRQIDYTEFNEDEYLIIAPSSVVTSEGTDIGDGLFLTKSKKTGDHLALFKGEFVHDAAHVRLCLERAERGDYRQYGIKGIRQGQVLDCYSEATDVVNPNKASKANSIGRIKFRSNPSIQPNVNAKLLVVIDSIARTARLVASCDITIPDGIPQEILWNYNFEGYR